MSLKHLTATVTKATESGSWSAVASAPTVDRDGEVVAAYAMLPLPPSVPVHEGHDFTKVVGRAVPRYDSKGRLLVEGKFSSVPEAQRVRTMVVEGVLDSMSIAFHNTVRENRDGVPTIVSAELIACDFVSVPSNREARVLAVRGYRPAMSGPDALLLVKAQVAALQAEIALLPPQPASVKGIYAELSRLQTFLLLTD